MCGVSKPFWDTCYSCGNIWLRVEGSLDLARRCLVVSLLLFSWVRPASTHNSQHFKLPRTHFWSGRRLLYLIWKRMRKPFIWTHLTWYLRLNNPVFKTNVHSTNLRGWSRTQSAATWIAPIVWHESQNGLRTPWRGDIWLCCVKIWSLRTQYFGVCTNFYLCKT